LATSIETARGYGLPAGQNKQRAIERLAVDG
jgi:hypothetical protein